MKYYLFHLETPDGAVVEDYRVFPDDIKSQEVEDDFDDASSFFAADTFNATYEDASDEELDLYGINLDDYINETKFYSYMEEVDEEEYFREA